MKNRNAAIERQNQAVLERFRKNKTELPQFCCEFLNSPDIELSMVTRLHYSFDYILFFDYLHLNGSSSFKNKDVTEYTADMLDSLTIEDLNKYLQYTQSYNNRNGKQRSNTNGGHGQHRKVASLRSLFHYCFAHGWIQKDISLLLKLQSGAGESLAYRDSGYAPLSNEEVHKLLEEAKDPQHISPRSQKFWEKNRERNIAVIELLLHTGITVSELVRLDVDDVDFENHCITVLKRNNYYKVPIDNETEKALLAYRQKRAVVLTSDTAFFLALRKSRMDVRDVQTMLTDLGNSIDIHLCPSILRKTYSYNAILANKNAFNVANNMRLRSLQSYTSLIGQI